MAKEQVIGDDGYNHTYDDDSVKFKDRMKDVQKVAEMSPSNERGGFVLGLNGDFGPIYDANPGSGSGMGVGLGVEPGFIIQNSSWSRVELGAEFGFRSFSWKADSNINATMTPVTFMPRLGVGFGLGNNLFGVVRFGLGMAMGQATLKTSSISLHTDSKTGYTFSGGYDLTYGSSNLQFLGGIGVTHYQYSFTLNDTASSDYRLNLNHVDVHGGIRYKF